MSIGAIMPTLPVEPEHGATDGFARAGPGHPRRLPRHDPAPEDKEATTDQPVEGATHVDRTA